MRALQLEGFLLHEIRQGPLTLNAPMKSFKEQNLPFYSGNVTYMLPFEKYKHEAELNDGERLFLSARFYGATVRVSDGDSLDEIIAWEPYEVEITDAAKRKKDLFITVLGTRKNTFGPLHVLPCVVHRCGHGSFTTSGDEWTDDYNLISDGLREIRFDIKK